MALDEHLTCPQCGYDLYGIPEVRCPECGFGYDAAALRAKAASAEYIRLVAADDVIVRSVIAAAFAVPAVCDRLGITGWAQFCVIATSDPGYHRRVHPGVPGAPCSPQDQVRRRSRTAL